MCVVKKKECVVKKNNQLEMFMATWDGIGKYIRDRHGAGVKIYQALFYVF